MPISGPKINDNNTEIQRVTAAGIHGNKSLTDNTASDASVKWIAGNVNTEKPFNITALHSAILRLHLLWILFALLYSTSTDLLTMSTITALCNVVNVVK